MQVTVLDPPKRGISLFADESGHLVEVLWTSTDDIVDFSPQGGGFLYKLPRAEFESRFKPSALPGFSLKTVSAEWLPGELKVPAYLNGRRWNGWAMPYFPFEAAHALLEYMPDLRYAPERDAFVSKACDDESEEDVFLAETLVIEGTPVKVYAVGAGSWCWSLGD